MPERRPRVAAHLEQGLREPMPPTRRHARDARGFRVEHRGAASDERNRDQQGREAPGKGQKNEAQQREAHPDRKGIRHGSAIGVETDDRLQQGGRELEDQSDEADLPEIEIEGGFQNGVDGGDQRLHEIVHQMREADGQKHAERKPLRGGSRTAFSHHIRLHAHFSHRTHI
jgi:hypothetical protein